jgi:two-component system, cell cycle response regulator
MNTDPPKPEGPSTDPMRPAAREAAVRRQDDPLLHPSIFGLDFELPPEPAAIPSAEPAPTLHLSVIGLKPMERDLLQGLVKVSQRRSPRLVILEDSQAGGADVVMIDARDAQAMTWARQRPWLAQRAVIWIDGTEAGPGHTLVRRPVQWPILPMMLARALESRSGAALPSSAVAASAPAAARPVATSAHVPQILVVDDSLAVRAQLRSLLEESGYAVTDADSVEAALACLARRRFDCVLMDVMMPDLDGYEGCRVIKARLQGSGSVPVVMLTSKSSSFDRLRGKMAGCDAYLTKPVDPQHLDEVLAQQVGGAPRRRSAAEVADRAGQPTRPGPLPPLFVGTRPM